MHVSAAAAPPEPRTRDAHAGRAVRLAGAVIAAYLVVTAVPLLSAAARTGSWTVAAIHLVLLAALAAAARSEGSVGWTVRDLLPLATGPYLYVELRWLIPAVGRPHADPLVQRWEGALFPGNPSVTWAPSSPNLALSEALHLAYASYYLLVLVPPVALYLRGRREEYGATLLGLAVVYAACFLTYLVLPVDGPRFLVGPAAAPDGPVRASVVQLLAAGSSRGTAFPSSHVAASVVSSLFALRFQPRLGVPIVLLTVGLAFGTVYGGFHYAVDAVAGGIVGAAAWATAVAVWLAPSKRGEQSATAAR